MSNNDLLKRIPRGLPSDAYNLGNEFKPFHPSASHVPPEARDAWNRCYVLAQDAIEEAVAKEREACISIVANYFKTGDMLQRAGEMSAQELRTAKALGDGLLAVLRAPLMKGQP